MPYVDVCFGRQTGDNIPFALIQSILKYSDIGRGYLSIVYTFGNSAIHLISGIPQHVISNSSAVQLQFDASADAQILTVTLTPFQGRPMAYISTTPGMNPDDPTTYEYVIYSHINIPVDTATTFYICACNMHDDSVSRYYITASEYNTNILLQAGVPRQDDIEYAVDTHSKFYYFNVTEPGCHLALLLTTMVGNPDMFVSTNDDNHYPDADTHELSSEHSGSDSLTIRNASVGMYWIGIMSATKENIKYSVSGLLKCSHEKYFTYLLDGQSQTGLLGSKKWGYYKFEFNYHENIKQILIQVNPGSGDPNLYVDVDISINLGSDEICTGPPGPSGCTLTNDPSTWLFESTQYGSDHIRLGPSDYQDLCDADPEGDDFCTIDVAIYGWSPTVYTVMVSTNRVATYLRNGKPNTGYISYDDENPMDPVFVWYAFDIENMNNLLRENNISISITPLVQTTCNNSIETVFYVDGDSNPTPSASSYKWKSIDLQHPYLIIDGQAMLDDDTINNEMYIAVTSNQNLTFSIHLAVGAVIQLADGQYQVGHVKASHSNHYGFIIDTQDKVNQGIEVLLNTHHGNVNLYVSSKEVPNPDNKTTYEFYNNQTGMSIKRLLINNTLVHKDADSQCNDDLCRFYITVATPDPEEAEYTIRATTAVQTVGEDTHYMLEDGVPVTRTVDAEDTLHFKYSVMDNLKRVTFALTPIAGSPKCFISSTTETPSADNFEYKCNEDSAAHSISIDDVSNGTNYHIAICSGTSSTFTLSAIGEHDERSDNATDADIHDPSTSDTYNYRVLIDGTPQMDVIHGNEEMKYYSFRSQNVSKVEFTLKVSLGEVSMYITKNEETPSVQTNEIKLEHVREDESKTIDDQDPCDCSYFIVVIAQSESVFSIIAATGMAASQVTERSNALNADSEKKGRPVLYVVIVIVVLTVVSIAAFFIGWNWEKLRVLPVEQTPDPEPENHASQI